MSVPNFAARKSTSARTRWGTKRPLGSRVDRHEHIGLGKIGLAGFKPFVRDKAFKDVPKILETAKGKDENGREWDAVNLEALRGLM